MVMRKCTRMGESVCHSYLLKIFSLFVGGGGHFVDLCIAVIQQCSH